MNNLSYVLTISFHSEQFCSQPDALSSAAVDARVSSRKCFNIRNTFSVPQYCSHHIQRTSLLHFSVTRLQLSCLAPELVQSSCQPNSSSELPFHSFAQVVKQLFQDHFVLCKGQTEEDYLIQTACCVSFEPFNSAGQQVKEGMRHRLDAYNNTEDLVDLVHITKVNPFSQQRTAQVVVEIVCFG